MDKTIRVLFIINNLGSGGAERSLVDFLNANRSIEPYLITLTSNGNKLLNQLEKSVPYYNLSKGSVYNPIIFFKLFKTIKKWNIDIIHAHLFPTFYLVAFIKIFHKKSRLVLTEHGITNKRRHWQFLNLEKLIYSMYDSVMSVSNEVHFKLLDWIKPINTNKYNVVPNGISLNRFSSYEVLNLRKEYGLNNNSILLLTVARLTPEKNIDTLIRSMLYLDEKYILFIIGEGFLLNDLKKLVENLKINNRVFFLGFKENAQDYYHSVNGFVSTSLHEGFGIAAMEAYTSKLPLFLSKIRTFQEIFSQSAIYFNEKSSINIASQIKDYFENNFGKLEKTNPDSLKITLIQDQVDLTNKIYSTLMTKP